MRIHLTPGFARLRVALVLQLSAHGRTVLWQTVEGALAVMVMFWIERPALPAAAVFILVEVMAAATASTAFLYIYRPDALADVREVEEARTHLVGPSGQQRLDGLLEVQRGRVLRSQLRRLCWFAVAPRRTRY